MNFLSFVVSATGFFLISVVMLRGIFSRRTVYFGFLTMVVALVAGLSWFVPAIGGIVLGVLLLFGVWGVRVGLELYRVGLSTASSLKPGVPTDKVAAA